MPLNPKLEKFLEKDLSYMYSVDPQQARKMAGKDLKKLSSKPEEMIRLTLGRKALP